MSNNYVEKINELEKTIQSNKLEQAKLTERAKSLNEEREKLLAELSKLGVEEPELENEIKKLEESISKQIKNCEDILK